jgi:putative SOS response-associated peptidase YedK
MCGRYVAATPVEQLAAFFTAGVATGPLAENFNVAPTTQVYGVVQGDDRTIETFRWGLVPPWADDLAIGSRMINARSETVFEKASFRNLILQRRLIVPMSGFYEWRTLPTAGGKPVKLPMYITRADGEPLAVAGLHTLWRPKGSTPETPWVKTCSVLTTAANGTMAPVHDRMPVLLERSQFDAWLDPTMRSKEAVEQFLMPAADDVLVMREVGTAVNSVRNKGASLLDPP